MNLAGRQASARVGAALLAAAGALYGQPGGAAPFVVPVTGPDFCARAQQIVASTPLLAVNLEFADPADFIRSKPRVRPLETDQHVTFGDDARRRPVRVSCKMKSADHIRAEYGESYAGEARSCRDVNADTVDRVFETLNARERDRVVIPRDRILLAEDRQALTGAAFTRGADRVRMAPDGRLVIRALSIRVDWDDWRWRWMPDRFRGQQSCHLVAPEHLRRLILGQDGTP